MTHDKSDSGKGKNESRVDSVGEMQRWLSKMYGEPSVDLDQVDIGDVTRQSIQDYHNKRKGKV